MLDSIGESVVRTTTRQDNNLGMDNKETAFQKIEKVVEERPVEASKEGAQPENKNDTNKKRASYKVDENGIFFEKYDKRGNVVFRAPPEKKPIDEHV